MLRKIWLEDMLEKVVVSSIEQFGDEEMNTLGTIYNHFNFLYP